MVLRARLEPTRPPSPRTTFGLVRVAAIGGVLVGCSRIPSPDAYQKAGDGFTWCRHVVDAGDSVSASNTWGAIVLGVIASLVVVLGGIMAKDHAEKAATFAGARKWFVVLSGFLGSSGAALTSYLWSQVQYASTAGGTAQKSMSTIPAPASTEYATADYAAWQNCQLAVAAWRGSHEKALEQAMNQLDSARKQNEELATVADQAKGQLDDASSKTASIASAVAAVTDEVKDARAVVTRAKQAAQAGGGRPGVSDWAAAEDKLNQAESRVQGIDTTNKSLKSSTDQAATRLLRAAEIRPAALKAKP